MRHHKKGKKFGRKKNQRKALLKSLATNLIMKQKIKTTETKAKEVRSLVERLVTRTKKRNLSNIRYASTYLAPVALKKLINQIAPKYAERNGGYVRIVKIASRKGDGAKMVFVEFV